MACGNRNSLRMQAIVVQSIVKAQAPLELAIILF